MNSENCLVQLSRYRWVSWIVGGLLLAIFGSVFITGTSVISKAQQMQAVGNGRAIQFVVMFMAREGEAKNDKALGWPGDLKACGSIATLSDFMQRLVEYDYLKSEDLRIFGGPRFPYYQGEFNDGVLNPLFEDKNSIFKVFLVKEDDPPDTVFLMSKCEAFGSKGVVVISKNGGVYRYKPKQLKALNLKFPGNTTEESAENCLNPDPPRALP